MNTICLLLSLLTSFVPIKLDRTVEPEMTILEQEQRNGYDCMLVEYNVSSTERLKAYLLVPDDASPTNRKPGLVLLHDHGARFDIGKEKLVQPLASAPINIHLSAAQWSKDNFDGVFFGDVLASKGYVVIVPEQLYWGGRSTELCQKLSRMQFCGEEGDFKTVKEQVYEGQRAVYDSLYAADGTIWAEKTLNEDAAAAGVLKKLKYVDRRNIGCFGWSMGAHRAWMLTAFCKDIKTGVALCWMTLKETCSMPYKASDYSMLVPRLRDEYDFPDIAQWLAPKPFFFLNGSKDKLFPLWASKSSFAKMQETYKLAGAQKKLKTEFFDGPHHCGLEVQNLIIDYFNSQLAQ